MPPEQLAQPKVGDNVAVQEHEGLVEERRQRDERARGPEQRLLDRDPHRHRGAAPEVLHDRVRVVVEVDRDLVHALPGQILELVVEQRPRTERDEDLRHVAERAAHPGAEPGGEQNGLQRAPNGMGVRSRGAMGECDARTQGAPIVT